VVTGVAVDPAFELANGPTARPFPAGYILAVGGGDLRKNVECALRAHARSRRLQDARVGLVVIGNYPEQWTSHLLATSNAAGGDSSLVHLPGRVSEDALAALYRDALCVIVPSQAEGFSLPVVEGMAAGTAVIASTIPAHRELITLDELLFAPEDDIAASQLLDRIVFDPQFRRRAIESQKRIWRKFRGETVADVFWSNVLKHGIAKLESLRPAVLSHRRPRIAFLTPLPPEMSGVADYSAASLAEIAQLVDVSVFTETVEPRAIDNVSSIQALSALPHLCSDFDRVIGVVGNSIFHVKIFDYLTRFGGACIEHDARLLGFYVTMLGKESAIQQAERELGRALRPGELDEWLGNEAELKTLFLGELAQTCEPLCVHSRVTARLVQERYATRPILLPFSIYRRTSVATRSSEVRNRARAKLNITKDEVVIATFGFVQAAKAPDECIWALELLRSWNIPATLHFVGAPQADRQLVDLCEELGVEPYVKFFSDFVSEEVFRIYLAAADYAIQLRTYSFGALSGGLLDCIACGLPTIANQELADNMDAPQYVSRVPDNPSPVLIADAIANFLERDAVDGEFEEERRAYEAGHNMRLYARRFIEALEL
jgi:glycosyltransferase involved in cell wall biosynthesis